MKRKFLLLLGSVLLTMTLVGCNLFFSTSSSTTSSTTPMTNTSTTTLTTPSVESTTATTTTPTTFVTLVSDLDLDLVFQWQNDETWTVTGTAGAGRSDLEIPSSYQGHPVTGISDYGLQYSEFASLILPDSITHIGHYAITNLNVHSITFGIGLTSENVGEGNLEDCPLLDAITIGFTDENLLWKLLSPFEPYQECNLVMVNATPENPAFSSVEGVLFSKDMTRLICYPLHHGLLEFIVPDGVLTIGSGAFRGVSDLQTVIFPSTVTVLDVASFGGCGNLTSVNLPDGLIEIGPFAFAGCEKMTEIVIPESVSVIGGNAFADCDLLTIHVIVLSQPTGWNSNWNPDGLTVVWGYSPS